MHGLPPGRWGTVPRSDALSRLSAALDHHDFPPRGFASLSSSTLRTLPAFTRSGAVTSLYDLWRRSMSCVTNSPGKSNGAANGTFRLLFGRTWRSIAKVVLDRFGKDAKGVLRNFKDAFTSSVVDLTNAFKESDVWRKGTNDTIQEQGDKETVYIKSVQLPTLKKSPVVKANFEKKLSANSTITAAISKLTAKQQKDLISTYADAFIEHVSDDALQQLIKNRTRVDGGFFVLEVVYKEPYPSSGSPGFFDMVKLGDTDKDAGKQVRYWRNRASSKFTYIRNVQKKPVV